MLIVQLSDPHLDLNRPDDLLHHFTPETGLMTFTSTVNSGLREMLHGGQRWAE